MSEDHGTNPLAIFDYSGRAVRTVILGEDVWFVAADVCAILGHTNPTAAVSGLDDDERGLSTVETPSGPQQMVVVSEPGLYRLVGRSRKPEARAFDRWVRHEVLPSIRKTGTYSIAQLDRRALAVMVIEAEDARLEAEARSQHLALELEASEAKAAKMEPAAKAWSSLVEASGSIGLRETARLVMDAGFPFKRDREFFEWMNRHSLIYRLGGRGDWIGYSEAEKRQWIGRKLTAIGGKGKTLARVKPLGIERIWDLLVADFGPPNPQQLALLDLVVVK